MLTVSVVLKGKIPKMSFFLRRQWFEGSRFYRLFVAVTLVYESVCLYFLILTLKKVFSHTSVVEKNVQL